MPAIPRNSGIWPAMVTPLHEDHRPNEAMIDAIVELFCEQGVGGLYVCGGTGHGPALPMEHRKLVTERVIRANRGRLPVMVHVGCVATEDAIALARHAADAGADAISSVPPFFFPAPTDVLFHHYHRIAEATDRPFYPYHPNYLQQNLPPAKEYAERLMAIPHIEGIKVTENNLFITAMLRACAGEELRIFSGVDELTLQAAVSGADGAIGTFFNVWAPAMMKAHAAFLAGDVALGRRFMSVFGRELYDLGRDVALFQPFLRTAMRLLYRIEIGPGRTPAAAMGKTMDEAEVRRKIIAVNDAASVETVFAE